MMDLKAMAQSFVHQLFLVIQGSIHVHLAVTQKVPKENQEAAWREYNESFDQFILPQLLEVLEKCNCGIAELCHASLRLLEISAKMVQATENEDSEDEDSENPKNADHADRAVSWFVSTPH